MSDRYTSTDARNAFEHLARTAGAKVLDPSWKITDKRRNGAWKLDHNSTYGGYVITAICPSSPPRPGEDRAQTYTAETHPLVDRRLPAREFTQQCHFAARAIAFAKDPANARRARR